MFWILSHRIWFLIEESKFVKDILDGGFLIFDWSALKPFVCKPVF